MSAIITVAKAEPVGEKLVEGVELHITGELNSRFQLTLNEIGARYLSEALMIMTALKQLPQGTRHELLIQMLRNTENMYVGR